MTNKLTNRKARTVGILFSSTSSRRAFSWLLQYSSYTQNLSFCKTRTEPVADRSWQEGGHSTASPAGLGGKGYLRPQETTQQQGFQVKELPLATGPSASTPASVLHLAVTFQEAARPRVKCTDSNQPPWA